MSYLSDSLFLIKGQLIRKRWATKCITREHEQLVAEDLGVNVAITIFGHISESFLASLIICRITVKVEFTQTTKNG
jgi:hypothetical protein